MSSIGARKSGYSGRVILPIVKSVIFVLVIKYIRCKNNKMAEYLRDSSFYSKSPFYQLFITLLYILVIGGLIFLVFLIAGLFIFDPDPDILKNPLLMADKKNVLFLQYLLISQHVSLFIIPGIILIFKLKQPSQKSFPELKIPDITDVIYVLILAFCLFPVTGITGELNSRMNLPEWLSGVENWMKSKENMAERLFEVVLSQDNPGSIAVNCIMIAVLPAIGEELIFRGIVQRILTKMFRSGHLAVWVTAFVFSALHFQFYGFVPRFILGLVFGYLFLWSGILWLPVIAHFINNAVSMIGAYIQSPEQSFLQNEYSVWGQLIVLLLPVIAITIILIYFRKKAAIENAILN
jgi:membrane protease YdiL (CAAX protease family)